MSKKLPRLSERALLPVTCPGCHRVWEHASVARSSWCLECAPSTLDIPYPKKKERTA